MRNVKKKNILDQIDDSINDRIDEIQKKKKKKRRTPRNRKETINESIKDKIKLKDKIIIKDDNKDNKRINKSEDTDKEIILEKKKENKDKKINNNKKKTKKVKRPLWKKIVTIILILGIIGVLSLTLFMAFIVITAPKFSDANLVTKEQTVIYDIKGDVITTLAAEKRENATYDELPQVLIDAIIATEDSRYFQHNGVDLLRFVKATALQLIGHGDAGGASTLTMQTVKNMVTKQDKIERNKIKKVIRKFHDVYLSVFKIEKKYSKEEILEIYVNDNYLGGGYYGVKEASKYYFNKPVSELTLPEAALIAGLFQLPTANNPYTNIEGATKRRDLVLKYMYNHGYITKEERDITMKIPVESLLAGNNNDNDKYQGYVDTVVAEVTKLTKDNPYTVPMKIYTTMERSIQDGINKTLSSKEWYWEHEEVQAGIAVVNAETGAIAAVGAGRNKTGVNQFNYATQAYKQPGSTAKPIFDYGPGIEYNNFSSYTLFNDEPWSYTNGPSINNWNGTFEGLMTTRYALQYSRNIPALKAFQQIGPKNSQKFAYSLGLDVSLNSSSENYRVLKSGLDNTINEAYSIGGAAEGFTPLTMASAYAAFANGGYYTAPYCVTKIEYRDTGETKEFKNNKERVMKDSTAYIMNNILESAVTNGFDGGAKVAGSHVAAKTGTSNFSQETMNKHHLPSDAVNDLWTIAYTPKYSIALWYGYDEVTETTFNRSSSGSKNEVMRQIMQYIPKSPTGWSMPSSVVAVQVEKETWPAKLPSQYTPSDLRLTEFFVRGTQPTETSERFAKLGEVKNIITTKNDGQLVISWDYDTPAVISRSYIEKYFSNSQFGRNKGGLIENRIKDNNNRLGNIGFGIYEQGSSGNLKQLDFTTEKTYTYRGYGTINLVIKAEYEKFKANASDGMKVNATIEEPTPTVTDGINISLNGSKSISANAKLYKEEGIKNITYGNLDITNTATVKYQVTFAESNATYDTKEELEDYINTLAPGTYTIKYIVTYLGEEASKSRTLILR